MTFMNPDISVIVSAYNTEAYITKAIKYTLEQTLENLEVIVVDNGSTDRTGEIARTFSDPRLKVLSNEQNMGVSCGRNCALREAKGKWIAILDSDDWFGPQRLERLLQIAEAEDVDMIADDLYYIKDGDKLPWSTLINDSGERINQIKHITPEYFVETDLHGKQGLRLGLTKSLIKRDFLLRHGIEYDKNIELGQDFSFYLICLAYGARFILVPQPYYFYRSRPGSLVTRSQLDRIGQACATSRYFIEQEIIQLNSTLVCALSKRLNVLEKNKHYFHVVDPLKQGKWLMALWEMIVHPYFFVHFVQQIPRIAGRWINYYITKIKPMNNHEFMKIEENYKA